MSKLVIYIHGQGGTAEEAKHYNNLFRNYDVTGFDYKALTPFEAKKEFPEFVDALCKKYNSIILIANSIGAYFAMHALSDRNINKAFFISPIVDMEKLILDIMTKAGVTENELKIKKEISTSFGEKLSWEYLSYVRENPITWNIPTSILYGEKDNLTSYKTISDFAAKTGAELTVMKNGEHWFHTEEQMRFLDLWINKTMLK